jgi:hypothetical protein
MRKREGLRPWHLAFALILLAPPAARIAQRSLARSEQAGDVETLRSELAAAREEVRRARLELAARGLADPEARHAVVAADALPLGDPSPARGTLWAAVRGGREPPGSGAALSEGALAGRVVRAHADLGIVKIQTLLDPAFRARFRKEGASGMLWGTGRDIDGHALLEVRHLAETAGLAPGEPVFTEGNDGVYPGGIVIGFVASETEDGPIAAAAGRPSRLLVRSAIRVEDVERITLPVDLAAPRLSEALRRDHVEGGLGVAPGGPTPSRRRP